MSLVVANTTNTGIAFVPSAEGVFRVVPRLLGRLRESGELPHLAVALRDPANALATAAERLAKLRYTVPSREAGQLTRELTLFEELRATRQRAFSALPVVWPTESPPGRERSLLPRVRFLRFGLQVEPNEFERESPYFPTPPTTVLDPVRYEPPVTDAYEVARLLFDGPMFREYLGQWSLTPQDVEELVVDRTGARGSRKFCFHLSIRRQALPPVELAMRVSARSGWFPRSETGELQILSEIAHSPTASLVPRHPGGAVVMIRQSPAQRLLVFFNEWVEGKTLWDLVTSQPTEGRRLAVAALETFCEAVRRVPAFSLADVNPRDIVVRGSSRNPRFTFLDFGTRPTDPLSLVRWLYGYYVRPDAIISRADFVRVMSTVPSFRSVIKTRLGEILQGGR